MKRLSVSANNETAESVLDKVFRNTKYTSSPSPCWDMSPPAQIRERVDLSKEENRHVRLIERENGQKVFLRMFSGSNRYPSKAEITAALNTMIDGSPSVAFLSGHGERDIHHQMGQPLLQMDMPRPAARQRLRPLVPPPNEITLRTNHILCFFPLPSGFPSRSGGGNHFSHTLSPSCTDSKKSDTMTNLLYSEITRSKSDQSWSQPGHNLCKRGKQAEEKQVNFFQEMRSTFSGNRQKRERTGIENYGIDA